MSARAVCLLLVCASAAAVASADESIDMAVCGDNPEDKVIFHTKRNNWDGLSTYIGVMDVKDATFGQFEPICTAADWDGTVGFSAYAHAVASDANTQTIWLGYDDAAVQETLFRVTPTNPNDPQQCNIEGFDVRIDDGGFLGGAVVLDMDFIGGKLWAVVGMYGSTELFSTLCILQTGNVENDPSTGPYIRCKTGNPAGGEGNLGKPRINAMTYVPSQDRVLIANNPNGGSFAPADFYELRKADGSPLGAADLEAELVDKDAANPINSVLLASLSAVNPGSTNPDETVPLSIAGMHTTAGCNTVGTSTDCELIVGSNSNAPLAAKVKKFSLNPATFFDWTGQAPPEDSTGSSSPFSGANVVDFASCTTRRGQGMFGDPFVTLPNSKDQVFVDIPTDGSFVDLLANNNNFTVAASAFHIPNDPEDVTYVHTARFLQDDHPAVDLFADDVRGGLVLRVEGAERDVVANEQLVFPGGIAVTCTAGASSCVVKSRAGDVVEVSAATAASKFAESDEGQRRLHADVHIVSTAAGETVTGGVFAATEALVRADAH